MNCVYILQSIKLNRFYIGYTSDFDTRIEFHKNAESHKFTANGEDWVVFLKIPCENKTQGLNIEKHIKKMRSKTYIENLIKYPDIILKLKERYK
jgi:putative endonuclease